jgi:hypothetical protein
MPAYLITNYDSGLLPFHGFLNGFYSGMIFYHVLGYEADVVFYHQGRIEYALFQRISCAIRQAVTE